MIKTFTFITKYAALLLGLFLWLSFDNAQAQAQPTFSQVYPPTVSGNTTYFGPTTVNSANASRFTFGPAANGSVYGSATQSVRGSGGKLVNVIVKSGPPAATVAKLLGGFAFGPVVGAAVAGYALYDLVKELGLDATKNANGKFDITRPGGDGFVCNVTYPNPSYSAPYISKRICIPNASGSNVYTYGYSISGGPAGVAPWPGATFPCGNLTCQAGYVWYPIDTTTSVTVLKPIPVTQPELEAQIASTSWPPNSNIGRAIEDAIKEGYPLDLPQPYEVTGPSTSAHAPSVTTNTDGSTITTTRTDEFSYGPNSVSVTQKDVTTTTDASGNTVTVTDVNGAVVPATKTDTKPAELPDIETCGLPGKPACKIDETGTPKAEPETKYDSKADEVKTTIDANRTTIGGTADKPFFAGWSVFFNAPPLAQCSPVVLPDFNGATMGSIDPCGTVDGMRTVMGYIWALGGLFMCLGMVRKVV